MLNVWRHRRALQPTTDFYTEWGFLGFEGWFTDAGVCGFGHLQSAKEGMHKGRCSLCLPNKTAVVLTPLPTLKKTPTLQPHAASESHGTLQRQFPSPLGTACFKYKDLTRPPNVQQWYNENVLKPLGHSRLQLHGDFYAAASWLIFLQLLP